MPLKLNVGVSKKVGLPDYGSAGASCHVEVELDSALIDADPDAFRRRVRAAYAACHRAVLDELARLDVSRGTRPGTPPAPRADGVQSRAVRPATDNQVRAIRSIAARRHADLAGLLRDDYGVGRPEDLSVPQASRLLDALKADPDA